jgi:hypothetical protein
LGSGGWVSVIKILSNGQQLMVDWHKPSQAKPPRRRDPELAEFVFSLV